MTKSAQVHLDVFEFSIVSFLIWISSLWTNPDDQDNCFGVVIDVDNDNVGSFEFMKGFS